MSTWARTSTGDMLLPRVGDGQKALVTDPTQQAAIQLQDRFDFWLGEWFLDTSQGFPWLQIVGQKPPPLVAARQLFRRVILDTVPIIEVEDLAPVFNKGARDMRYPGFTARTNTGATITGGDVPFLVNAPPRAQG